MRILGQAAAAAALLSMATVPALAAPGLAAPAASKLSLRAATASKNKSDIAGAPIIAIIGIVAIVAGGVIIATQDDDTPDSP